MWITHIRLTKILFRMHEPDKSKGRDLYGLCISLNSCEEICISAVLFVDPGYFVLVTEVVNADQFLFGSFSYQGKKGFFPGFQCVCRNLRGKYRMAGADGLQLFQDVYKRQEECTGNAGTFRYFYNTDLFEFWCCENA